MQGRYACNDLINQTLNRNIRLKLSVIITWHSDTPSVITIPCHNSQFCPVIWRMSTDVARLPPDVASVVVMATSGRVLFGADILLWAGAGQD